MAMAMGHGHSARRNLDHVGPSARFFALLHSKFSYPSGAPENRDTPPHSTTSGRPARPSALGEFPFVASGARACAQVFSMFSRRLRLALRSVVAGEVYGVYQSVPKYIKVYQMKILSYFMQRVPQPWSFVGLSAGPGMFLGFLRLASGWPSGSPSYSVLRTPYSCPDKSETLTSWPAYHAVFRRRFSQAGRI